MTRIEVYNSTKVTIGPLKASGQTQWRELTVEHQTLSPSGVVRQSERIDITLYIDDGAEDVEIVVEK